MIFSPRKTGLAFLFIFLLMAGPVVSVHAADAPASAQKDLCSSIPPNQAGLLAGNCESYFVVADAVGKKMVDAAAQIIEADDIQNPSDVSSTFNTLLNEVHTALESFRAAVNAAAKTHPVDSKAKLAVDNAISREIHSTRLAIRSYSDMAKTAAALRNAELILNNAERFSP